MRAALFVGRVGGLAVALGAGATIYAGAAWADSPDTAGAAVSHSRTATTTPGSPRSGPQRKHTTPAAAGSRTMPARPARAAVSTRASASVGSQVWSDKGITLTTDVTINDGIILGAFQGASSRGGVLTYTALGGADGGKLTLNSIPGVTNGFTVLPYATWMDAGGTKATEQFRLGIREYTLPDLLLASIPLLGTAVLPVVNALQDTPLIGDLLAPLIGASVIAPISVDVATLAPGDTPVAFTYKVTSFDGVEISTNFFPAVGLTAGATAATSIIAPGFGGAGITLPYNIYALKNEVPGVYTLRSQGYNVITFDPRGEFDSGGVMRMAEPNYEGKDTAAIVSWVAANTPAALNAPGDPRIGMVGGSYGGALQLASAQDARIDALVPVDSWSTLLDTFYPSDTFKTAYGALYLLNLLLSGARVDPQLYLAVATGLGFNWLGPWSKDFMNASNPPLSQLTAPTLLGRGTEDVLVPLSQGDAIASTVLGNGLGTTLKTTWFTGGHGAVGSLPDDQSTRLIANTISWLDTYVKGSGTSADAIPNFQWYDQKGTYYSSPLLAFQDGFNNLPAVTATASGGLLGIVPILGGSGPGVGTLPINLVNASPASNAINVSVPTSALAVGTQVVGAPTVSFTYRGLGISGAVYAQVIDDATGTVLGNLVTPIPVILDGRQRTVNADIGEIAYTVGAGDSVTIQITTSATAFENASFGLIGISDVTVTLPNRTP